MMELVVGTFAIALVTGCICAFAVFIAKSLRVQNSLRSSAPQPSGEEVNFDIVFYRDGGEHVLKVNEGVALPPTSIAK